MSTPGLPPDEAEALEQAIAHMEAQRGLLGSGVVDPAIAILRERLDALRARAAREERRHVTVLFADLAGFTAMAEAMDPEEVGEVQATFFQACRQVIERNGGVVENFIDDAVMAVFGIPVSQEHDPSRAVMAGLDLQRAIEEITQALGWGDPEATQPAPWAVVGHSCRPPFDCGWASTQAWWQ